MVDFLTVVKFLHILAGMAWIGSSLYVELIVLPSLKRMRTTGEFRTLRNVLKRTGPFLGLSGIFTLVTGLSFLFLKYGTDFGVIWSLPSGRLILIALALVVVALVIGFGLLLPTSLKMLRTPLPDNDAADLPQIVRRGVRRIDYGALAATVLIVFVLFLMVVAAAGGF